MGLKPRAIAARWSRPSPGLPTQPTAMASTNHVKQFQSFSEASSFLWSIANLLRGTYKQHDFGKDDEVLREKGVVKTLYDPACGTGGMLSVAEDYLREMNPDAHLEVYGQELNDETYAICKADMLLKAENPGNITRGNSFSQDGHAGSSFDYMLSNPPFGVECWLSPRS